MIYNAMPADTEPGPSGRIVRDFAAWPESPPPANQHARMRLPCPKSSPVIAWRPAVPPATPARKVRHGCRTAPPSKRACRL